MLVTNLVLHRVSQNYVPSLKALFSAISELICVRPLAFYREWAQVVSGALSLIRNERNQNGTRTEPEWNRNAQFMMKWNRNGTQFVMDGTGM